MIYYIKNLEELNNLLRNEEKIYNFYIGGDENHIKENLIFNYNIESGYENRPIIILNCHNNITYFDVGIVPEYYEYNNYNKMCDLIILMEYM